MTVRSRSITLSTLLLGSLTLSGCAPLLYSSDTRVQDTRTFRAVPPTLTATPGATLTQGVMPGIQGEAAYAIEVPDRWNGTLVMYTHGYAGMGADVKVQVPALREYWLSQGYAWAASSYSSNYYDVRAGVEDTNALALAFPRLTGKATPGKYVIVGFSMGGHVAGAAVEAETAQTARNRVTYAAAMPMCGVMDQDYEFQWLGDYTAAAAQLAGTSSGAYPDTTFQKNLPATLGKLFTSFSGPVWQENDGAGAKLRDLAKTLTGGERPVFTLGFRLGGYQQAVLSTGGSDGTLNGILPRNLYTNQGVTYRWTSGNPTADETAFNAALPRTAAANEPNPPRWDGVRWLPRVQGNISVPVLTMHTTGDFYVPFRHQQLYRQHVNAQGHGDLLVQRAIRAAGHCEFTAAELVEGFNALMTWQTTGQKPAGDDVTTPAVIADPNYGCAYTRGTRAGVAPCPGAAPAPAGSM